MARHGRDDRRGLVGRISQRVGPNVGFWMFLISNVLWVVWAMHVDAPALIVLQVGLATMNIRGALKTETAA
jgi:hypothetical protein